MKTPSFLHFLLLCLLSSLGLKAQSKIQTTNLFYDSDKHSLTTTHRNSIDSFFQTIPIKGIERIILHGHTDSDADNEYNVQLSLRRSSEVKNYLTEIGIDSSLIQLNYHGEEIPVATNNDELGKQRNRRVEIIVFLKKKKRKITIIDKPPVRKKREEVITPEPVVVIPPKDPCAGDTLIKIADKMEIAVNKCQYEEIKNCLVFEPLTDLEDMLDQGITTMTTAEVPLASCGMVGIYVKEDCEPCFDPPLKVRFILDEGGCDACTGNYRASVWNVTANGRWSPAENQKMKKRTVGGKKFYETIIRCTSSGTINCDCKQKDSPFVVKVRGGIRLLEANLVRDCPLVGYSLSRKNKRRRKGDVTCFSEEGYFLYAKGVNRAGDTLYVKHLPIENLKKYGLFSRCKGSVTKRVLGVPIRKRSLYRKYILRKEHFKKKGE